MLVYFARSAWQKAKKEATKWYRLGLAKNKKPFEAIAFPLTAVFLKAGVLKAPIEMVMSEDVESVAVAQIAIPPDAIKNYSAARANFRVKSKNLAGLYERFIERKILTPIEHYPLLEVISRLHTHPFAKMTGHSGGDRRTINSDDVQAKKKGFGFSLSFILTCTEHLGKVKWNMSGYAVNQGGREDPLRIELAGKDNPVLRSAFSQPYYKYDIGRLWEEKLELLLKTICQKFSKERMPRGWTSYWFKTLSGEFIVCLPPDFPVIPAIKFSAADGQDFSRRILDNPASRISEVLPGDLLAMILET